ncbi:ATP-binding protein [Saccharothrix syringae]|uniref:ATP-binding protein n=1 Tax=Saccharothrix syringae TaxID=103733 RepID=A0A5Q0GXG9_SACSY|nr:ATP-binding protein [Saccharothrix syringae]QFZ18757.1 ATP-binding protein [Saccharothrix syringae]
MSGGSRSYQAGRDLHVHEVIDQRVAEHRRASGAGYPRAEPRPVDFGLRATPRGRDEDLAFLRDNVAAGRHVALVGPAGIGKSLLVRHAVNAGLLAVADAPVLWPPDLPPDVDDIVQLLVHECFEVPPDRVVPRADALRMLRDVRAVVVLDGVEVSADGAREVLASMPRSVFVLTSRHDDLFRVAKQRVLPGLPLDDAVAVVRDEVGDPVDLPVVERDWADCGGNPARLVARAVWRRVVGTHGVVPEHVTDTDVLRELVPRVLDRLTDDGRAALATLGALGEVGWGGDLLAAVSGSTGAADLLPARVAVLVDGRYVAATEVLATTPPVADADLPPLVERITHWVTTASPAEVASEVRVVERALSRSVAAELHEDALSLARAAVNALALSRHWGALAVVLHLGLRAAAGAGSVRDELSFRYALAVRRLHDGSTRQAAELLAAAIASLDRDDHDDRLATRVRELDAEVHRVANRTPLPAAGGAPLGLAESTGTAVASAAATAVKAVRDVCVSVVTSTPGGLHLVRFVQDNPGVLRVAASAVAVVGVVLATMTASGNHEQADALPPSPDSHVEATGVDGKAGPTTTTTARVPDGVALPPGSTTTTTVTTTMTAGTSANRATGIGADPQHDQDQGHRGDPGTGPTTEPVPATWGFARVWYVDRPLGSTHALSGPGVPDNGEANWTYGPWRMSSPPAGHPTATHVAVGVHRVRLPAVGAPGGSVQVTIQDYAAWGGVTPYRPGGSCQPRGWYQDGADEVIDVLCSDLAGTPVDQPFFLRYTAGRATGARGFVFDDQPAAATFTPDGAHGVNAGAVTRTAVGRYTADLPGSAGGAVDLTAVGALPRHCAVTGRRGDSVDLACTAPDGTAADTMFTAAFAVRQNFLDDPRKPVGDYVVTTDSPAAAAPTATVRWSSGGTPVTLDRTSTGKYKAHFANGYIPSTMHVTASGYGNHCGVMQFNDYSGPDNASVWVACFDSAGTLVNTGFTLSYTSARIY